MVDESKTAGVAAAPVIELADVALRFMQPVPPRVAVRRRKGIEFGSLDVEAFRGHLKIGRCFNETPRVNAGFGQ